MNGLDTLVDAIPLVVITVLGGWLLNGRLNRLERKVDSRPTREEFNGLVHRVDRHDERFDRLDSKIDGVRSDLTQIAIALGTQTKPQAG